MKKKIFLLGIMAVALMLVSVSCLKDDSGSQFDNPIVELPIDGDTKTISVERNGIGIEFCLLNEQGEPATVFKEGENFRFRLSLQNNTSYDAIYMTLGLGYGYIPDEFYVFDSFGDTIGRPFYFQGADYVLEKCPVIKKGKSFVLDIPWIENRDEWHICTLYAHGLKNKPLPKGVYYTILSHKFCFRDQSLSFPEKDNEIFCTDSLLLKINFEIK